jgi:hypothetical protein
MKNRNVPNGKPMLLYALPHMFGTTNYICPVDADRLRAAEAVCPSSHLKCDETVFQLCNTILDENLIEKSSSALELRDVYIYLRSLLYDLLQN